MKGKQSGDLFTYSGVTYRILEVYWVAETKIKKQELGVSKAS
jgi:hypothetical protein